MLTSDITSAPRASRALLKRAVERSASWSVEGALERAFSLAFGGLVYPQIWEDPRVDIDALEITPTSRLVTIASGGCNVMSYLTASPERIFAVDLNRTHIALTRLKLAAAQHLVDHREFRAFFADADDPCNVDVYWRSIAPHLDAESRQYWEGRDWRGRRRVGWFARGIHRHGLLGRFIAMAHLVARLHGQDPRRMMLAQNRQDQQRIFEQELAPLFDRKLVRWLLGHRTALYGLGIPPAQYRALLASADHMADVVRQRLCKLATGFDLADNYFAWQAFNRGYRRRPSMWGPLPPYLQSANFHIVRENALRASVELASYSEFLSRQPAASLDGYVLLDAQDWMSNEDVAFLWAEITRTARKGARVVFRTAGEETILPGRVPAHILSRWTYA
ncbi:MAG: DUF3419 family protein, partial [Hyphomicrobiaceae bacterium]